MTIDICHPSQICEGTIKITGSKSETNRLLLLQALYPSLSIENSSNSDDSIAMTNALEGKKDIVDIHHAGTAMRFLTAFFSTQEGREVVLTGSSRMQERPIKILVDALRKLGADIQYENKEGYPPLRIKGKKIKGGTLELPANISSQYISALLLIAPILEKGIQLDLKGEITSLPYIEMTLTLLKRIGVNSIFEGNKITISHHPTLSSSTQLVESDWSSSSYFFSCVALSKKGKIKLQNYTDNSIQGDSVLTEIYKQLGVNSKLENNELILEKEKKFTLPNKIELNLIEAPDIAQTIAVSCYGLGIACDLTGLHTLKIKETDRLEALYNELTKLGATLTVTDNSLHLSSKTNFKKQQQIKTYHDHRMALSFAPLGLKIGLQILEADVVTKSFPNFWKSLQILDFQVTKK